VTPDELGGREDDDIGAVVDGADQTDRGGVVDDERHPGLVGYRRDRRKVGDVQLRVPDRLGVDRPGLFRYCRSERLRVG
jgi:hypothetical protein